MRKGTPRLAGAQGDRFSLTIDQLALLEGTILPTARRWLAAPGLDLHAMRTLDYWGESYEIPKYLRDVAQRERGDRA